VPLFGPQKIWTTKQYKAEYHIKFKIATLTFKALETGQPPYLSQQLCPCAPTRALRSSTSKLLQVPRTNRRFGSRSFHVSTPTLWNSLPRSIRFCESLTTFQKHLKTFFIFKLILRGPPSDQLSQYPVPYIQFLVFGSQYSVPYIQFLVFGTL